MGNPFNVHCPRDFVLKMTAEGTVSNVKVSFNSGTQDKINKKLYEVQQMIDSEVLRRCDPLVPLGETGNLKGSGTEHTEKGSGNVIYRTVYARKQYYIGREESVCWIGTDKIPKTGEKTVFSGGVGTDPECMW